MDLRQRLEQLEKHHDWYAVVEVLEQGIKQAENEAEKAELHLRLGRLLHTRFLQGVKALKHFQDAFKLDNSRLDALGEARAVYWELGKLNMVQKLLELQIKNSPDGQAKARLLRELGDVLWDQDQHDAAASAYARALQASDGLPGDLPDLLEDVQIGDGQWQDRIGQLLRGAHGTTVPAERAIHFIRAARIAKRYAPGEVEGILAQAYGADPTSEEAAALYESLLVEADRTDAILEAQRGVIDGAPTPEEKASAAFRFGVRWAMRHQNQELGTRLLEEALALDPSNEAAFVFIRETYGAAGGDWSKVIQLADELAEHAGDATGFLLASAGMISWREVGDIMKAKGFFSRLGQVAPGHPALRAFEAQIGDSVAPAAGRTPSPAPATADTPAPKRSEPPAPAAKASEPAPARPTVAQAHAPSAGPLEQDDAVVAKLTEKLHAAEGRPHEYVKALMALGDALSDPAEKATRYSEAADLYVDKFANQAEAVKAFEKVLECDGTNERALAFLREMYEKRRDWEKLISLRKIEAQSLDDATRIVVSKEIAQLATERVKKPELCIELWQVVLDADPSDPEAIGALAGLYERARDYEKLADVLEKLAEVTYDTAEKIQVLNKLGQVVGDRLKNDERAADAYRMLLTLDPNDRRAQEQLKKRYAALGRWDDLEQFYADAGNWDEFIRLLETNESRTNDPAQSVKMLMKVAELWMTQKGKPDRAARAYEKILKYDESHLGAAESLIPLYESANNPKGLAGAIEVKLAHVSDTDERLALLRQVAELYEGRLNDKAKAFDRYLEAFRIAPGDAQCQADVERVAQVTSSWDKLTTSYREAVQGADGDRDLELANILRLRLGRVLVEEVKAVDEALVEYRAVYEADPENGVALGALENLYRQTERWSDLLEVYGKKRELALDPDERKKILYGTADLYEKQMRQLESAIETYRAVLEDDAGDAIALAALDRLYRQTEDWEPYAEILNRRIELDVTEVELIDLKFRLADTQQRHLGNAGGALENYREILFLNQDFEGARVALEGLLQHEDLRGDAASILESIYEAREDWEKLLGALEILVKAERETGRRVELLNKIAGTAAGMVGDVSRAFEAQARAVKEDPSISDSRVQLEQFAETANKWDDLIRIYNEVAEGLNDPTLARAYLLRLAAIEERLGKVVEAAQSYEKILALDPSDAEALQAMDSLYRGNERWDDLIGVFRKRIDLTNDGSEREALYAQMAQVYEEKLGKVDEAISAYREVLALEPSSQVALSALDGLFTRQSLWPELAENLETQLGLAGTEGEQLSLMLRLAALREGQMQAVDAAVEGYREVLDRDPSNPVARAALERLGREAGHELHIAEILEPLYRQQGDYAKLIGVHEVQVRRSEDTHRRVELLLQIAELYEDAASDPNSAFDTYARALAEDPGAEATQQGIDRLARATGRFDALVEVYTSLAEKQKEPELGSQLFSFAARLCEHDVGNVDKAIELYRRVLGIDPMNLAAAEALQALFQQSQRYSDMSLILQRKAEILEDVEDRKAALYEAATLEEEVLERRENAIGVYQKILEIDAEDLRSVDALVNLYLALSRWEELLGVYARKVDLVLDTEEKKLIYYQVGAVYEREIGDVARAIDTYQKVLELDPDDLTALGRLDVLYQTAGNWHELLGILQHEAELTADAGEAIGYQFRIAELYEKHLSDVPRAVDLYRDILGVQADHGATLNALEGIKGGEGETALAAASVLEPVYEAMGEWQRLISCLEVQARYTDDLYARVDLLHRIARLYEESIGNHESAFQTFARAVEVDCQNEESLGSLERLAMTTNAWPAVAGIYDRELAKLTEQPERFVDLGLRVAQLYEVQLENVDGAVERYRRVLGVDAENQSAVRSLDRLFSASERWTDLAEILAKEAEIGQTPEEILEFKHRLGQVYQLRLGNLDKAIEAYREVIGAAPEHVDTLQALEGLFESGTKQLEIAEILDPLYQSSAEWEKLIKVHEAQLAHTSDPDERMAMYYRIAEDAEERLMDPAHAFGVYVRAMKERPLDERTGEDIERLAGMIDGGWEHLANAYADVLGVEGVARDVQATVGKRLARVFEEELADIAKAEETYRYVLTVAERDQDALANLDRIYSSVEQWAELAGVLEHRAASAVEEPDRIDLYTRLGQVYEEQLAQPDNAIRAYRVIFDGLEKTNEHAIDALARLFERKESWTELETVYLRELETAVGDVEEAEIRAKLAHLAATRLGKIQEATDGWKRVLELRGEDPEALGSLANLYDQQQQWAELSDVLERQFDISDTDDERVSVMSRRARLFTEQLGRDDEALETWQRVLDIDFSNVVALRSCADIWRKRENPQEFVGALHATIDRAAALVEPDELVAIYRELGRTYGQKLEQPFEASEAWRNLLEVDPGDFEAIAELEKIYRAEERWPDVVGVKMQRAEALEEPAEKIREFLEVTEIWKREVNDYDQATPAFERILSVDPTHQEAFEALERLHTAANRWEPLIELYLNRLETRETHAEKSDLLRRIAGVFEEKLDDKNQAFDALVNAFSEDYGDDESSKYLERMAQATGRWGELINTANAWLQSTEQPHQKIQLCLRLGKWYGEDLGHPEYAQPYYQQIMALDPNNVQVLRQMANIHRMGAQWQKMGETLTRALDVAVAKEDRKAILCDLGELLERNMGQMEQGISFYKRALEVDPLCLPALEALEKIYDDRNDHTELAEILSSKVRALKDPAAVAQHKLRLAGLYETSLGNFDLAGRQYKEVLDIDGASLSALRGLERIYESMSDWPDLVGVLERQLDVVETERERVDVLLKVAQIQEEQFLKADIAAQRLEQALEIDPTEERAYIAIERCYRRLKQWLDLIGAYERHISEVASPDTKVQIYGEIAVVYTAEVGDIDRAIDAYQNIVDLDEANIPALEALSKLFEKQGDAARAIESMTRVADLTTDGKQRVDMYFRIGKSLDEQLGDRGQAQERYEMALDLDPAHLPSLAALRTIAVDDSDWDRATRYLDQEQLNTEQPRARARLLVELGRLRAEMLSEEELAIQAYELALQCDADCDEAAQPLVEFYVKAQRWEEAEPLADLLLRKARGRERAEQHMLHNLAGKVYAALGRDDKALKAYAEAHKLDMTDQETIRGIADVSFRLKDWPSALSNYQKVLTALGEEEVEARTEVYFRLGCIKREQNQAKQAINNFEKALALNSEHRPTLDALVDVYSTANDWKQVAAYKRQILDSVFDGQERFAILNDIADIWSEKEKAFPKAIEAAEEARDITPNDHRLLHKLLQLYQKASDWEKMVDTIQAICDLEEKPENKARYFYTMAQVYRDKLDDRDRAVELFNETLDMNPDQLEAFERINKILTTEKDWKQLERSYRKMLHRIAGKGKNELEHTLWHQLGLIYRDRMGETDGAIDAFKMAVAAKPGAVVEAQILAELYESTERWDEAIAEQRKILENDALRVDPYRALYRLYLHKRAYDEAWCVASAMAFMRKADEEEKRFYEDYKPEGMLAVKGRLTNDLWKHLFHPDQTLYISKIFEMIAPAALQAKINQLKAQNKAPNLDKRFKQDPATSTVTFAKTFGWAAQVLGVQAPELYVRNDVPGSVVAVPAVPPASVAGQTVLTGFQPHELTFICGKHLASYRGENYIRNLFPTQTELTIMLFAGMMIASPSTPLPADMQQQIQMTAQELAKYMQPQQLEGLRVVVKRFIEEGATANMKKWHQSADLTGGRAGLLVCGDLETAKKIITQEPQNPGDLTAAEKMKDILVFSVSESYAQLRKALGVAIGD